MSFRANTCDHMIYDGACECNERRVVGDDFTADLQAMLARTPTTVPYDTEAEPHRPTATDLAVLGAVSLTAARANRRSVTDEDMDATELSAALAAAYLHTQSEDDFLTDFLAEVSEIVPRSLFRDPDGVAPQGEEHLENERLADIAEQNRLREYLDDITVESEAFLEACTTLSHECDENDGYYTPVYDRQSNYYEMEPSYEGVDY